jgi:hypothetical protein
MKLRQYRIAAVLSFEYLSGNPGSSDIVTERAIMHRQFLILAFLSLIPFAFTAAQDAQNSYFLTKIGRDTLAAEEFTLDAHALKGTSVVRNPRTTVRDYAASFDDAGKLQRFHITYRRSEGAMISERDYAYSDDSVQVTNIQDTSTTRFAVGAHDRPFPLFIDIFGPWQAALRNALASQKKEIGILAGRREIVYNLKGGAPGPLDLVNAAHDFEPLHARMGSDNKLEQFDLTATTDKFVGTGVATLDVKALTKEFASHEQGGKPLGALSPRDTLRAEVHGAHLMVDYGRPSMRGRKIFGNVVPWDSVWRTGANAATQFMTDKELQFGTLSLPPGTYTLFSIPGEARWQLIINSQHGQWGTAYDSSKDLARLPLEVKRSGETVERFTFGIAPEGVLQFKWENTEASIPFTVK